MRRYARIWLVLVEYNRWWHLYNNSRCYLRTSAHRVRPRIGAWQGCSQNYVIRVRKYVTYVSVSLVCVCVEKCSSSRGGRDVMTGFVTAASFAWLTHTALCTGTYLITMLLQS